MPEIVEPIIEPIGLVGANPPYYPSDYTYDIAIAGLPFYLAASQNYPYKRETAPYKRTQIDQTREPGEQSLLGWWLRSQSSFHLGSGVKYQEPTQGDTVGFRFYRSAGVDAWQVGKATSLRKTDLVLDTTSATPMMMGAVQPDGTNVVFVADNGYLYILPEDFQYGDTPTTVTWGGTGDILAMAQDGENYYVTDGTDIYKGSLDGTGTGASWYTFPSPVTNVILAWVKQRLMAAADTDLIEIVGGTGTVVYTNPVDTWKWTGIAEGPNSIYFSGYCGTASNIIRLNLDTNGTLPTLTNAIIAAELPGGEYITSLASYVGRYIAIGTNLGVRIGTIDSGYYTNGAITYGPLSVITNGYDQIYDRTITGSNVTGFSFYDRFVYATVTNYIQNHDGTLSSGLVCLDLSRDLGGGMFAWATDLRLDNAEANAWSTATVLSSDNIGVTDRKAIATSEGIYFEDPAVLTNHAYLETGQIRYLTVEDKHFKLIKPRLIHPMTGNVELYSILPNGTMTSIMIVTNAVDPTQDINVGVNSPQESIGFRFEFYRDALDNTKASTFTGYQLKSLPAVRRVRQLTIPLMNFDFEEDRYNAVQGYEGRAWDRISQLESIESNGDYVLIQDYTTGEAVQAVIETLQFVRMTPPERRYKGFGGILYVTARTV